MLKAAAEAAESAAAGPSATTDEHDRDGYIEKYAPLQWDPAMRGDNITLKDDNFTAAHSTSCWNAVCGTRFFSEGIHEIELSTECVDNISLFFGVVSRQYWEEVQAAETGEVVLPRDSKHAICVHGDGRVFIRGVEKDWGLMRFSTGDPVFLTIDFTRGVVNFKLVRQLRGKEKETVAEIPGLRGEVTVVACFGGRDQELRLARCDRITPKIGAATKKARDVFAAGMGDRIAPIAFCAPSKGISYEQQVRDVAATMESSM